MKIIKIINSRIEKYASFERFLIELAKSSRRKGNKIICIFPEIENKDFEKSLKKEKIQFYVIRQNWVSLSFVFSLLKLIRKENPQIIHFHFYTNKYLVPLLLLLRICSKRTKIVCNIHHSIKNLNFIKILFAALLIDQFITVSKKEEKKIQKIGKTRTIYNGIDITSFDIKNNNFRKEFGIKKELITSIASLIPIKGIYYLIKACDQIIKNNKHIRCAIVGSGSTLEKYSGEEYKKLVKKLGLEENIIFTGVRNDIPSILANSDVFVLASLEETFGFVLTEAMAASKPVVATNVGGIPEVVEDGKTGILVPPKNPAALANAIIKLLKNPGLRKQMGEAGRKRAEEYFTMEKMVKEYEDVYDEIIK
jgi:glycosyltransferase involved in cell wall biosynthesis